MRSRRSAEDSRRAAMPRRWCAWIRPPSLRWPSITTRSFGCGAGSRVPRAGRTTPSWRSRESSRGTRDRPRRRRGGPGRAQSSPIRRGSPPRRRRPRIEKPSRRTRRGGPPGSRPPRSPTGSTPRQPPGTGSRGRTGTSSPAPPRGPVRTGSQGRTRWPRTGSGTSGRTRTVRGSGRPRPAEIRSPRETRPRYLRSRRWTRRCDSAVPEGCRPARGVPFPTWHVAPGRDTRPTRSSGALQDPLGAGGHRVPDREGLRQGRPTAFGEPVVLPRRPALRLLPPALYEPPLLEPPQRRVQRPFLEVEKPVGFVAELVEDLKSVLLFFGEQGQEAELDRTFLQFRGPLGGDLGHRSRLVSETRYMGVRGARASRGGTSFTRRVTVGKPMDPTSSGPQRKSKGATHRSLRRASRPGS